ncbi:hypothetical protein LXA43DRAFT_1101737 [Ganoderma leucocontextum]|nr:hypothetical protein LXA43DRAFT_1101737 [Ganoderma leucocontextum]
MSGATKTRGKAKDMELREDNAETTDGQERMEDNDGDESAGLSELDAQMEELKKTMEAKRKAKGQGARGAAQRSAAGPSVGKEETKGADAKLNRAPTKAVGKGKRSAKPKAPKVTVKVEDLDLDKVNLTTPDQVELDAAIIGFVRVRIVNPDPTVKQEWRVVNERDIDKAHLASVKQSLRQRKVDWEHPMIAMVNGAHIDPKCVSLSPLPMKDLKEITWTCPAAERRIHFLSGNHRQKAVKELYQELVDKEAGYREQLDLHEADQAAGAQGELNMQGQLVDRLGTRLEEQLNDLTMAEEEMARWTTTLYDDTKLKRKPALVAQLASNEARPAKAEDVQERAQIMFWKLEAQMGRWIEENGGDTLPVPGTTLFRTGILNVVFKESELKEGTTNFLFTQQENLALIRDLWQLAYFKVSGCVPLVRLSAALGRPSKKDLSKKSGSAMLWRWMVHACMRDIRLIGTTDIFPDLADVEDEDAHVFRNYEQVLTQVNPKIVVTEEIWAAASLANVAKRQTVAAQRQAEKMGIERAKRHYDCAEDKLVQLHKLSPVVWSKDILEKLNTMYDEEFRVTTANTKIGDWESDVWTMAMSKYRHKAASLLGVEWKRALATMSETDDNRLAVSQAGQKLAWFHQLQELGERRLNIPFLCDKFLEDFSNVISRAEMGFKVITRTLDPLAQIGMLRAQGDGKSVFPDYLSYVCNLLGNRDRFTFTTTAEIHDALAKWLLANIDTIRTCGDEYATSFFKKDHESFYGVSMNQLNSEVAKLHISGSRAKQEVKAANDFPNSLKEAFKSVTFGEGDYKEVFSVYTVLRDTVTRSLKASDKLTPVDRSVIEGATNDTVGRIIPSLPITDVKTYPCLALLYRHALTWEKPESGPKTGVSNGFLCYAYLMVVGWRVYGDTLGRMLQHQPYIDLRESLFTFLGEHCQPDLADFFGRPGATKKFANWDSALESRFVDLSGQPLSRPEEAAGAKGKAAVTYLASNMVVPDASRMSEHTLAVKKAIDGLGRWPLALGANADSLTMTTGKMRKEPWSREVALVARKLACAMMRNALQAEYNLAFPKLNAPYTHISDEDLAQYLPELPEARELGENEFEDLEEFAFEDPDRYTVYCHGLVAEGYEDARTGAPTESEAGPSTGPTVHRKAMRPSGQVYTQDMDWSARWAQMKARRLDRSRLPDPVAALKAKRGAEEAALNDEVVEVDPTAQSSTNATVAPRAAATDPQPGSSAVEDGPERRGEAPPRPRTGTDPASTPAEPGSASAVPAKHVSGGLDKFAVRPKAKAASMGAGTGRGEDAMDVDVPGESGLGPLALPAQPSQPETVLVPSSSQVVPEPENEVESEVPMWDDRMPMSSVPDMVPNTFPNEPSQAPRYETFRLQLEPPTDDEVAEIQGLVEALDVRAISEIFQQVMGEVTDDPAVGWFEGEPNARYDARRAKFWHLVSKRKGDLLPDEIFAYLRDDHPAVRPEVPWSDWTIDWGSEDGAGLIGESIGERFPKRADADNGPVYEREIGSDVPMTEGPTGDGGAGTSRKRQDRSSSIVQDTRADGGMSPPKARLKQDPPASRATPPPPPLSSPTGAGEDEDMLDPEAMPPPRQRAAKAPTATRTRAGSSASGKAKKVAPAKKAAKGKLVAVDEEDVEDRATDDEGGGGGTGRPGRVAGKQMAPRKN